MSTHLAADVELLGPYRDSGLERPPYLIRRGGRILQVSRLLHTVAAASDGTRTLDEMAAVAAAELDRPLTGDDIAFLVTAKLVPAGIVSVDPGPGVPTAPAPDPMVTAPDDRLLALRFRWAVVSAEQMEAGARWLGLLFQPAVVLAVLAGVAGFDVWLFGWRGVGGVLTDVARHPASLVVALLLVCLSGAFHELGHAAGCRYSGGRPGAAGVGLYLWWPVLYTNVTDAYRLDRRGRLRTDLGGIYFNAVFVLVVAGAYAASGYQPLLALVVLEHLLVLQQLLPVVRLDGYYIVSDLTGVPDIMNRVRPAVVSLIPGRPPHPAVSALRRGSRRLLFAYLISVVLFLALILIPSAIILPRTLGASWTALGPHVHALARAAGQWDTIMFVVDAAALAILAVPFVGLALTAGLLGTRLAAGVAGIPRRAAVRRRQRDRRAPRHPEDRKAPVLRRWDRKTAVRRPGPPKLTLIEGAELPGGGAVDWFGFGFDGQLVVFGTAPERLTAAADELASYSSDTLDRLLIDGLPFCEQVARAARLTGRPWDEVAFRGRLDETLARKGFTLVVLGTNRPEPSQN